MKKYMKLIIPVSTVMLLLCIIAGIILYKIYSPETAHKSLTNTLEKAMELLYF